VSCVCVCVLCILETYIYEWKHANLGWPRLASDKIPQSSTLKVLIPSGAECTFDCENCKNWVDIGSKQMINVKDFS